MTGQGFVISHSDPSLPLCEAWLSSFQGKKAKPNLQIPISRSPCPPWKSRCTHPGGKKRALLPNWNTPLPRKELYCLGCLKSYQIPCEHKMLFNNLKPDAHLINWGYCPAKRGKKAEKSSSSIFLASRPRLWNIIKKRGDNPITRLWMIIRENSCMVRCFKAKNRHFENKCKREAAGTNEKAFEIYQKRALPWHHHQNNTSVANHDDKLFKQMIIIIAIQVNLLVISPSYLQAFLSFRVEVFTIFDILLRLNGFSEAYRKGRSWPVRALSSVTPTPLCPYVKPE